MGTTATMVSVDELQALEQKVLQAVQLIKKEREARATAEAEIVSLREQLELQQMEQSDLQQQFDALKGERENVRGRMEKLLEQLDTL